MMKKKSGKRFLSWLLAAVMIIALMPANAFAEPPTERRGNKEYSHRGACKGYSREEPAKDTPAEEPVKDTPAEGL